ncbi:Surp module [Aphelenchoides besseyi]|nr:Surp module [Aphelenchoides besseyi]
MSFHSNAPEDLELRAAIDRFAVFVASNGPNAEEATRRNNVGNPRMSFLFGGTGHFYYQDRLALEIDNLRKLAESAQTSAPAVEMDVRQNHQPAPTPQPDPEIEAIESQIQTLRDQIAESEKNLQAHHDSMKDAKRQQVDKLFQLQETEKIVAMLNRVGVNYDVFVQMIDHLAISGSKEHISKCKHWISENCDTDQKREIILSYLLHRCRTDETSGNLRLHLLYLINDWAYFCQRQHLDSTRQMLSRYVPKLYCHAAVIEALADKLEKLVSVWEKYKYFDEHCYKQLADYTSVMTTEEATIAAEKIKIVDEVENELQTTYTNYQRQHFEYENHILAEIANLQRQINGIKELRAERSRLGNQLAKEKFIPKAPYYELPAGMMVPLIAPESVTFEPLNPNNLRLPVPTAITERLKTAFERFYAFQQNPRMSNINSDGWEINGLADFYALKNQHKHKLIEQMKAKGKTFEDAVTNRLQEQLEVDQVLRPQSSSSSSGRSSRSSSPEDESRTKTRRPLSRSRSPSPDSRPSFGATSGFLKPFGANDHKKSEMSLQKDDNRGANLMQKMGWQGGSFGSNGRRR